MRFRDPLLDTRVYNAMYRGGDVNEVLFPQSSIDETEEPRKKRCVGTTPNKTLRPSDEKHPERAIEAYESSNDSYFAQVFLHYDRVQKLLGVEQGFLDKDSLSEERVGALQKFTGDLNITERTWNVEAIYHWVNRLRNYEYFPTHIQQGVLVVGPPCYGKSTICEILSQRGMCIWSLGKDQERLVTFTHRDGAAPKESPLVSGEYFQGDYEDQNLINLALFSRSKFEERFKLNVICSILARNGVIPVVNGGLVHVDCSCRAYGGYLLDNGGPVVPLNLAPWRPELCLLADLSGGADVSKILGIIAERSLAQGTISEEEQDDLSLEEIQRVAQSNNQIGGMNLAKRMAPIFTLDGVIVTMDDLRESDYYKTRVIDTSNFKRMERDLEEVEFSDSAVKLNVHGIVTEMELLLPELEPGTVISHISPHEVVAAARLDSEVRRLFDYLIGRMDRKIKEFSEDKELNGEFITYLVERRKVLVEIIGV